MMSDSQALSEVRATEPELHASRYTPSVEHEVRRTVVDGEAMTCVRAREPISLDLAAFLRRRLAAVYDDAPDASTRGRRSLAHAVLLAGQPWPPSLGMHFLLHLAELLDEAEAAGLVLAPFSPRCLALEGDHLVVAPDPDSSGVDPWYIAPEQRDPTATVNARASQYGLAALAMEIFGLIDDRAGPRDGVRAMRGVLAAAVPRSNMGRPASIDPAGVRVLLAARAPDPYRRFSTASDFLMALEAACGSVWMEEADLAPPVVVTPPRPTTQPRTDGRSRRLAGAGAVVGLAVLSGGGAGWLAARRPAVNPGEAAAGVPAMRPDPMSGASAGAVHLATRESARPAMTAATTSGRDAREAPIGAAAQRPSGELVARPTPPRDDGGEADASLAAEDARTPSRSTRDRSTLPPPPPVATSSWQALANAVTLPGLDRTHDLVRRITDSTGFAAEGLRRSTPELGAGSGQSSMPASLGAPPIERATPGLVSHAGLRYPPSLLVSRLAGQVVVRFVVDSSGRVDPLTFEVIRSTHPQFTREVRAALRSLRYLPAERSGRPVAQTVEQTFDFAPPPA